MYMIIIGGGNVGINLVKRLIHSGQEVLLIEKSASTAQKLEGLIGDAYVMRGDGCDLHIQREAGFNRADVIVAATGEDEDNFVVCQLAKEVWNVERVIARVNDPSHEKIFRDIGIDETVSATGIIYNLIEQQITSDEIVPVAALHRGNAEIVESVLTTRSPILGKKLADVQLPANASIVYIVRDGQGLIATPETVFVNLDMLVVLVPTDSVNELHDILCPPH